MTFSDLKTLVSYWVDDLNKTYFTPTQLGVFINNAQREVQKRLLKANYDWYSVCKQTTLVVNQSNYALPENFLKLNRLEVVISGTVPNEVAQQLGPITRNQQNFINSQTGTPVCYYFNKNSLTILPAPNLNQVMRLSYAYLVSDMVNDTDVPDVPEQYQELIAIVAARDCLIKDTRESALLNEKLAQYEQMLKEDATQRNIDESRRVIETGANQDFGWDFY